MGISYYVLETVGQSLQIFPAMLFYLLCIPGELYRHDKKLTIRLFCCVLAVETLLRTAVKMAILNHYSIDNANSISSVMLILEMGVLIASARIAINITHATNGIIIFLTVFWASTQYMASNLIIVTFLRHNGTSTFDGVIVASFALVTAVLFPVMIRGVAPCAREYLRMKYSVDRSPVQIVIVVLSMVCLIHIFFAAWKGGTEIPVLTMLSAVIVVTYCIFMRHAVAQEMHGRMEMHLLSSQIQPHFVHNTLNAIYNIADVDPDATKKAIRDFSGYLRGNMEALENQEPVCFEEELERIQFYLSIEKLRYREELNIVIDTPVVDFDLPALAAQSMVENAVRHGLRGREGVGTVTLKTKETDTVYEIIISDDGIGFDVASFETGSGQYGRDNHYGIANTRERLRRMSGGVLHIESEMGTGTTVTICLPKDTQEEWI